MANSLGCAVCKTTVDGFLLGMNCLIHVRDPLFTKAFAELLDDSGVTCKKVPKRSPNLNAFSERFVRAARETLSQHIFLGERHLRYVLSETMAHYHSTLPSRPRRQPDPAPRLER